MTDLAARSVTIAAMRRRHLRSVLRIERRVYGNPWSAGLYLGELAAPQGRCYRVAVHGGRVLGYGGLMFVVDEAHVTTLAVDPAHRGRRIGEQLMLALCREAIAEGSTSLTLEVRADNAAAQALYRRFGLAPAGIRKGYYRSTGPDGEAEDALIMWAEEIDRPGFGARLDRIEVELRTESHVGGAR